MSWAGAAPRSGRTSFYQRVSRNIPGYTGRLYSQGDDEHGNLCSITPRADGGIEWCDATMNPSAVANTPPVEMPDGTIAKC